MAINRYDENERYEKIEDGVYFDTETEETVIVPTDEQQTILNQILRNQRESESQ
jgi:hypothetical protein